MRKNGVWKIGILVLVVILCIVGIIIFINQSSVQKDEDIAHSSRLEPYTDIVEEKYDEQKVQYAFVQISGFEHNVLLLTEEGVMLYDEDDSILGVVSGIADVYMYEEGKVVYLGVVECPSPSYALAIDQEGALFTASVDRVTRWNIDAEEKKLIKIEEVYPAETEMKCRYFMQGEGEIEVDNEYILQDMHDQYGEANMIRFMPFY